MRRFLISQLTRAIDFLKTPDSAPPLQLTAPENIEPPIANASDIDGVDAAKPAAFFPDKPAARDYLDYHSYAATLADLIDKTQTPLTVGVFGAWGSGKTTLMGMIETALREIENNPDGRKFMLVRFEAWKYYKEDGGLRLVE